jgi:hypothetical protein
MLTVVVAFAYASEVFPLLNREAGMSFSVFVNLTGAGKPLSGASFGLPPGSLTRIEIGLLTLFVPLAQLVAPAQLAPPAQQDPSVVTAQDQKWKLLQVHLLASFAVLNVVSFLLIFLLVPETARARVSKKEGKLQYLSLEEIRYIFGVPTSQHIHEQIRMIPGAWKSFKSTIGRVIPRSFKTRSGRDQAMNQPAIEDLPFSLLPTLDFDFPPIDLASMAQTTNTNLINQPQGAPARAQVDEEPQPVQVLHEQARDVECQESQAAMSND